MNRRILALAACLALVVTTQAGAATVTAVLLNDNDPWFAVDAWGSVYKVEWYGGTSLFWTGDAVLLTRGWGFASMIGLRGTSRGRVARVYVTRVR